MMTKAGVDGIFVLLEIRATLKELENETTAHNKTCGDILMAGICSIPKNGGSLKRLDIKCHSLLFENEEPTLLLQ